MSTSTLMTGAEILDSLALAVVTLDQNLCVDFLNPAAEVLFGVSVTFAQGQPVHLTLPRLSVLLERFNRSLSTGEGFTEREMRLPRTDRRRAVTVDLTVTPVMANQATVLVLEFATMDRHLRISRDDHLWQQQEVSREMIRGLAHEVKNPLGGLRGAAQLLARELPEPGLQEYTNVIIREADRLQALVDQLLGPNRLPSREPVNLHEVVEHVLQLCRAQACPGVQIERDYDPSLPELIADREQLIQALLNIAINAIEALGDEGRLTFRTRAQRQFTIGGLRHRLVLRVDVIDNGPGVPADMLERIFYPMVTTRPEGSGLGLAIAQNLVHNHGGLIECDSQPGQTQFSLFLPVTNNDDA